MWYLRLVETNLLPDWLIRLVIRLSLAQNRRRMHRQSIAVQEAQKRTLLARLRQSPIAIQTDQPNAQHYQVPTEFFQLVLGKWLKYSCCYWPAGVNNLDQAEEAMLALTCQRAQLADGMEVLDLGCGWGSLTLWVARHYPHSQVTAVSNSTTQIAFIQSRCRELGLDNVQAVKQDVSHFAPDRQFDRVISIEMFEHMKNYELLMANISRWLKPAGLLFVHVFSNCWFAYEFDASDPKNWMARTFFAGGTMPSDDLLLHFQRDLVLKDHWRLDGTHYARTLWAWLEKLDRHEAEVRRALAKAYGPDQVTRWLVNWRLFFMGCAETWGQRRGREYLVSHYLFERRDSALAAA